MSVPQSETLAQALASPRNQKRLCRPNLNEIIDATLRARRIRATPFQAQQIKTTAYAFQNSHPGDVSGLIDVMAADITRLEGELAERPAPA